MLGAISNRRKSKGTKDLPAKCLIADQAIKFYWRYQFKSRLRLRKLLRYLPYYPYKYLPRSLFCMKSRLFRSRLFRRKCIFITRYPWKFNQKCKPLSRRKCMFQFKFLSKSKQKFKKQCRKKCLFPSKYPLFCRLRQPLKRKSSLKKK